MEADGVDLAALLEQGSVPTPLPEDLDDLFDEDLLQFLNANGHGQAAQPCSAEPVTAPAAPERPSASRTSSGSSEGGPASSSSPPTPPPQPATAPVLPGAAGGLDPRIITTTAAQQLWTAVMQAAVAAQQQQQQQQLLLVSPSAPAAADDAKARSGQPVGTSRQGSRDFSADSSDTELEDDAGDSKAKAGNKRKAPEVDWRQIEDPAERRRQRRLAKNRVTAARSRERKKVMWSELEEKLKGMENENQQLRTMLQQFASENATLKAQLLSLTRAGAAGGASQARMGKTMDPAAILLAICTMLVVFCILPGDAAYAALGSVLPVALVASLLGTDALSASAALDGIFRLCSTLTTLLSKSGKAMQRSMRRLLFERHRYMGRKGMQKFACLPLPPLLHDWGDADAGSDEAMEDVRPAAVPVAPEPMSALLPVVQVKVEPVGA